jgi:hypothetical protein
MAFGAAILIAGCVVVGFATDRNWLMALGIAAFGAAVIVCRDTYLPQKMETISWAGWSTYNRVILTQWGERTPTVATIVGSIFVVVGLSVAVADLAS